MKEPTAHNRVQKFCSTINWLLQRSASNYCYIWNDVSSYVFEEANESFIQLSATFSHTLRI